MNKKQITFIIIGVIIIYLFWKYIGLGFFLNNPLNYLIAGTPDKTCNVDSDCVFKETECLQLCGGNIDLVNKNWNSFCPFRIGEISRLFSCRLSYLPIDMYDIKCIDHQCQKIEKSLTESEAISMIKNKYPEFKDYPNENLPPQTIRTEKAKTGWYVAFVQEGSGRPILGAKCFFVADKDHIQSIGEFKPSLEDTDFSIRTCSK